MIDQYRAGTQAQWNGMAPAFMGLAQRDTRPILEQLREKRAFLEKQIADATKELDLVNESISKVEEHPLVTGIIDTLRRVRIL